MDNFLISFEMLHNIKKLPFFFQTTISEAYIEILGIQDICHFTSRDIRYYPFDFHGYGILCSIFLLTFSNIGYLEKIIMGIFASL